VFKVDRLVSSDEVTLLLTNGGHNAGIVSDPSHPKRHYRMLTRRASPARGGRHGSNGSARIRRPGACRRRPWAHRTCHCWAMRRAST